MNSFVIFVCNSSPQQEKCNNILQVEGTVGKPGLKVNNKDDSLEQLGLRNGMFTICDNGQRIYGPPLDWEGPPPPQG